MDQVQDEIRDYVLDSFLPGAHASELTATTPLISSGVLDSIATTQLVAFLEERYRIAVLPHEHDADYMDTLELIAGMVRTKRGA